MSIQLYGLQFAQTRQHAQSCYVCIRFACNSAEAPTCFCYHITKALEHPPPVGELDDSRLERQTNNIQTATIGTQLTINQQGTTFKQPATNHRTHTHTHNHLQSVTTTPPNTFTTSQCKPTHTQRQTLTPTSIRTTAARAAQAASPDNQSASNHLQATSNAPHTPTQQHITAQPLNHHVHTRTQQLNVHVQPPVLFIAAALPRFNK